MVFSFFMKYSDNICRRASCFDSTFRSITSCSKLLCISSVIDIIKFFISTILLYFRILLNILYRPILMYICISMLISRDINNDPTTTPKLRLLRATKRHPNIQVATNIHRLPTPLKHQQQNLSKLP